MGTVFHVDFKNKKLVEKKVDDEVVAEKAKTPESASPIMANNKVNKKQYFQELIDTGMVQIFINPRTRGVKMPASLKSEPIIALNWSHKFKIKDFAFDDKGIRGTLSFNASEFFVDVPWKGVWAIFLTDSPKETMKIWEDDVPKEISLTEFMQNDKQD